MGRLWGGKPPIDYSWSHSKGLGMTQGWNGFLESGTIVYYRGRAPALDNGRLLRMVGLMFSDSQGMGKMATIPDLAFSHSSHSVVFLPSTNFSNDVGLFIFSFTLRPRTQGMLIDSHTCILVHTSPKRKRYFPTQTLDPLLALLRSTTGNSAIWFFKLPYGLSITSTTSLSH